jgi:hypothetical protein
MSRGGDRTGWLGRQDSISKSSQPGPRANRSVAGRRSEDQGDLRRLRLRAARLRRQTTAYEVDDVKCKDGEEYEIKLDPNFKLIVMTRD